MPEPAPQCQEPEFAIVNTNEAKAARKSLPAAIQGCLFDIIDCLAENPAAYPLRIKKIGRTGNIFIYTHPLPLLEITYEIDHDNKRIYLLHFAAPVLEVSKPVFISYSHIDREWLDKLKTWLSELEKQDLIKIWDDTEIRAGDLWKEEINKSLGAAKAAVLLVTQNFLASDFIRNNELPPLLEAAATKGVKILWIAVSESTVDDTDLKKYQALNDPDHPLDSLNPPDQNKTLRKIYDEIKQVLQ
jgi:TIR domain